MVRGSGKIGGAGAGEPSEERRLNVLLEQVEQQYQALSEQVTSLDQKIDRGLGEVRRDVEVGFRDLRMGITGLVKELREHHHVG